MSVGKRLRLRNIFTARANRALIVAMDHGLSDGPIPGIEDPLPTLNAITEAGANGVILNPGMFSELAKVETGRLGAIMRADYIFTSLSPDKNQENLMVSSVSRAVQLGADAVIANGYIGSQYEANNIQYLSELAEEAEAFNLPLCVEIKPKGPNIDVGHDVKYVKPAVRVAAELGADFVKTYYTGSSATFKEVIESATIPVVILGGPKTENIVELLQSVADAISAGGAGIAFGRNVWSGRDPRPMTEALARIIHNNEDPSQLAKELGLL